ncbi:MAG: PBP1A family penicillin-binding protein [Alphaproteobacteria bacterium]|nr:PBP1A family penicillin-binding protein [Alphaproteobacteria bacterium]
MFGPLKPADRLVPQPERPTPRTRGGPRPAIRPQPSPWRWFGRLVGAFFAIVALAGIVGVIGLYGAYQYYTADLPDVEVLRHYRPAVMSRIYAGDGELMQELATERRIFTAYADIPEVVRKAFVSAEDQNFWRHRGVDPLAIVRAALTDIEHMGEGRRPVGASTITQQVAKNMLLGNEVSFRRKIREAILAMRIEQTLSKERILELYLNEIYFGQQSYGVTAAAQAYFDKPLNRLTLADAAMLAALPKAPNIYNPLRNPEAARIRRDWVLERMAEDHDITAAQAAAAKAEPLALAAIHRPDTVGFGAYFGGEVHRRLTEHFGADRMAQGGLTVRTSMDPALQQAAERVLRDGLMNYDRSHGGWRGPVAHLDAAGLRGNWAERLAELAPPPGILPEWQLAVVLDETDAEAKLGWLDPVPNQLQAQAVPRISPMLLGDLNWARPVRADRLGPPPRRVAEVVRPGDVVMAELAATGSGRPERLLLRQIPQLQGALVSLDPRTGRVLALCGGWSHDQSQFNRATQALRQPGSAFKPFVYLTAMEQGISPSQRFADAPFVLDMGKAGQWRPNNYEQDFLGPTPLHVALVKSRNLVTLRVAQQVGMDAVAKNAIAFHVVDSMPRVLPAALGAVDTTVLRMAGAYASLDEGGREVVPTLVDSVEDREGHLLWRPGALQCANCAGDPDHPPVLDDPRKPIADPASVFQVVTMMQDVVAHGTGYAAGVGLNRPIAGKTGTTQDFNDAWFGGFTPDLVTVVWVGFDTPAGLGNGETGGALAAPIWHDYMAIALKNRPVLPFVAPPGVTLAKWDTGSGTVTDAFKKGQEPGSTSAETAEGGGDDQGGDQNGGGVGGKTTGKLDTTMGGLY